MTHILCKYISTAYYISITASHHVHDYVYMHHLIVLYHHGPYFSDSTPGRLGADLRFLTSFPSPWPFGFQPTGGDVGGVDEEAK